MFGERKTAITLPEFIRTNEAMHPEATSDLSNVLFDIALATKIVARGVNGAGLGSLLGLAGKTNVQGETVQKLDEYGDEVFSEILGRSGEVTSIVSEEQEFIVPAKAGSERSKYVVAIDPLDGSSNIDVNVAIGTIFGVYRRKDLSAQAEAAGSEDFFQPGHQQVASGYTIYGSSTMFVFTTGHGVDGFTLDPTIGEFILTNPQMRIPDDGNIYSCNEGNFASWTPGIKAFVNWAKEPKERKPLSARYVGSMVADFHRTMLKGGVFLYPADSKNTNGKLRHLYEVAPMSFLAEQAGGKASTGRQRVLDIVPNAIHQRTPLVIGSKSLVERVEKFVGELG